MCPSVFLLVQMIVLALTVRTCTNNDILQALWVPLAFSSMAYQEYKWDYFEKSVYFYLLITQLL